MESKDFELSPSKLMTSNSFQDSFQNQHTTSEKPWQILLTPNKDSQASFLNSKITPFNSIFSQMGDLSNPENVRQSIAQFKAQLQITESPVFIKSNLKKNIQRSPGQISNQSNDKRSFRLDQLTASDQSIEQSASQIISLAQQPGASPPSIAVTPELITQVIQQLPCTPSAQDLINYLNGVPIEPRTYSEELRQSQSKLIQLATQEQEQQLQIQTLNNVIQETTDVIKHLSSMWQQERENEDKLRSQYSQGSSEAELLRNALLNSERKLVDTQRQLQVERNKKSPDDSMKFERLKQKNQTMKKQLQENLQTFRRLEDTLQYYKTLENELAQKTQEAQNLAAQGQKMKQLLSKVDSQLSGFLP